MSWFLRHPSASSTPAGPQGRRYGHGAACLDDPRDQRLVLCCLPSGCPRGADDPIDPARPGGAVRVSCSDGRCDAGSWMMHGDCFAEWEEEVLWNLCSNGRGRSWSDSQQQRNQNAGWPKKSCDPVYNACLCMCGRGYLRRNLDEAPVRNKDPLPGNPSSTKEATKGLCIETTDFKPHHHHHHHRLGVRRSSLSSSSGSSGSSPASSAIGTPASTSPGSWFNPSPPPPRRAVEFFPDGEGHQGAGTAGATARGNIFARRTDTTVFKSLPRSAWNTYNIRSEDEGPHGTDETRAFLLTALSARGITAVDCAVCRTSLTVYDTYPLLDGTFYLSPVASNDDDDSSSIPVSHRDRRRYLSAVCMSCMTAGRLRCRACGTRWDGSVLVVGSMYAYDVFAAAPCCPARLACTQCDLQVTGRDGAAASAPRSYSDCSRSIVCPHCNTDDYHLVKPLRQVYQVVAQQ